jgi:hypothetical protein
MNNTFQGIQIDRYEVINANEKKMVYKCVTTTKTEDEILKILVPMYEGNSKVFHIFKNKELIYKINAKRKHIKRFTKIKDVRTGYIYSGLWELMQELNIKHETDAYSFMKNNSRYSYIFE